MSNAGMFNFEKLDVWQKAIDFADLVYHHTRDFPGDERFGLTNQMRRAAVSISSNIAEEHRECRRLISRDSSKLQRVLFLRSSLNRSSVGDKNS
jgi:hypothetical protein